jgi:hypothetical protein
MFLTARRKRISGGIFLRLGVYFESAKKIPEKVFS